MVTYRELASILEGLSQHQIMQIKDLAAQYLSLDKDLVNMRPCGCPKCGDKNAALVKRGFSRGKQQYQCKSCGKKFAYNAMRITSHSSQTVEAWMVVLEDTLSLSSLDSIAEKIGVSHHTAFNMRRKILGYMDKIVGDEAMLSSIIGTD